MAPRTKKDSAAPSEPMRRSTRLADKPAPAAPAKAAAPKKTAPKEKKEDKEAVGKKRAAAEETKEEPAAKKAKPANEKSKPASKPKGKTALKKAAAQKEEAVAEEVEEEMNDAEAAKAEVEEEKVEEKVEKKAAEAETAAEAPTEAPEDAAPGKELELGDVLPQVTLKNQEEKEVDVKSLITSDKGVIFFLVPKANTPGCTKQACGFRDSYPSYTDLGYEVYCLSGDSPAAQAKWKTSQKLPYPLLSDPSHTLIKALGASAAGKTKRSHFVFEKGSGKLILKTLGVKPDDSPKQVLAFLESHK